MDELLLTEKKRLVEKLGVLIETKDNLAPLAARILSYIILTGKTGTTFEDLVTDLMASKSTISTHLNHLFDLKKIIYFTKPGDRKKYYLINDCAMVQSIEETIESWQAQKDLHLEIKSYKERANKTIEDSLEKFELDFHTSYIHYLDEVIKSVTVLKEKINQNQS